MFSKYYQSELSYLREVGKEFARLNPTLAGLLSERGGDPDVERLLEGFAFLTARIRERMDDAVPEVVHGLAELLLPHYLRTLPACSIVEFSPNAKALRGRQRVPAGSLLAATPVEGTSCLFRTTTEVDLLPLTLQGVVLEPVPVSAPCLRLSFQGPDQGLREVLQPEGVRLFIHAEPGVSAMLMQWLQRHCRGVRVQGAGGESVRLGPQVIRAPGLEPEFPLLPWPRRAPEGLRLLQEYFTLPQKLLFFEVRGLHAAAPVVQGSRFELVFEFERPPALPARVGKDSFRLHCVPVINLFPAAAEPITHRIPGEEHLLRAAEVNPLHMEVYSVESVTGRRSADGERHVYHPFTDFTHGGSRAEPTFYRLRRALSPINDGIDTWLSLGTPRDVAPGLEEETLSIAMTCTHRSLPAQLQVGDICIPTSNSPEAVQFRNIVPVTRPARPPLGAELHWRLLAHLAMNQRSLAEAGALRELLGLYNFQVLVDEPAARANQLRVDSLRGLESRQVTRFFRSAPVRGSHSTLELDEACFSGQGEAFLFGCVLERLLASHVTLNAFHQLTLRLHPSQAELPWPPRHGTQTLC